ncbi:MAG: hypothetical protein M3O71_02535 [Bacteroidota bacterium]|nr:hypothetical protein [Bacteroidota bacterium]
MFNIFSSIKEPSPVIIEGWQKRYGKGLSILEVDGKKGYVRTPNEAEVKKIVKKLTVGGRVFDETKYLKQVMEGVLYPNVEPNN